MFHMTKTDFEDVRYSIEDWLSPESTVKDRMPFGQMPVLEVDGQMIPQSFAIARFVGKELGFAGKTNFEAAWVDAFGDLYKDFLNEMKPWAMLAFGYPGGVGDRAELKKSCLEPAREKYFKNLSKRLEKSKSGKGWDWLTNPEPLLAGFIVDSGITWADLFFYETTTTLNGFEPGYLGDDFPEVTAYYHRIHDHPDIKPYLETRPKLEK